MFVRLRDFVVNLDQVETFFTVDLAGPDIWFRFGNGNLTKGTFSSVEDRDREFNRLCDLITHCVLNDVVLDGVVVN
jgi:hypothetical protein